MSDGMPKATKVWPPRNVVQYGFRIGKKCICTYLEDDEGTWLELGGALPTGGGGVDVEQARIYYLPGNDDRYPMARVILPDDAPFRACRKGRRADRSKSFEKDGNPVPQVRMLYALKTQQYDDRVRAAEAFPADVWLKVCEGKFNAETFNIIDYYVSSDTNFRRFAGIQLADSASKENGLGDWVLWEKVADDAAAFTKRRQAEDRGEVAQNVHHSFIQVVKDVTIQHRGLPTSDDVKRGWENLHKSGSCVDLKNTLGFDWLPREAERRAFLNTVKGLPRTR